MRSDHDAEGTLYHFGQLAPFIFLLSGKKLFPVVSAYKVLYEIKLRRLISWPE